MICLSSSASENSSSKSEVKLALLLLLCGFLRPTTEIKSSIIIYENKEKFTITLILYPYQKKDIMSIDKESANEQRVKIGTKYQQ